MGRGTPPSISLLISKLRMVAGSDHTCGSVDGRSPPSCSVVHRSNSAVLMKSGCRAASQAVRPVFTSRSPSHP